MKVGDVVLVEDVHALRGKWKMAIVRKIIHSLDGKVRRVVVTYSSNGKSTVERAVQKLIVLVPVDE